MEYKMTIKETEAARQLASAPQADPHKLISLLMAGTLERVAQAKKSIENGNDEEKYILVQKIIAIINGLRGSLDFEQGGDIAINLDQLYAYMLDQIFNAETATEEQAVLEELDTLMSEVKSGWDQAQPNVAA